MEQFRTRETEPVAVSPEEYPMKEAENISDPVDDVLRYEKIGANDLTKWEEAHGKYGVEYFGIKEIVKEFPVSAQFGVIDGYLKSKSSSPAEYQELLNEMEREIGSLKLDKYSRIQKLSNYVKILQKYDEIKRKKETFRWGA